MPSRKTTNATSGATREAPHAPGIEGRTFSEPWKATWFAKALESGSLVAAATEAGVSLARVHEARASDPAFDEAYRLQDRILDLRITEALRGSALTGDVRSMSLYFNRVRGLILGPDSGPDDDSPLPSHVAEAMIRAGLVAGGGTADRSTPAPRARRRPARRPDRPGGDGEALAEE